MYTIIIAFYLSLFAIVSMVALKRREIISGKISPFSKIGSSSNLFFENVFVSVSKSISYINKHTFIAIAQWIVYHILLRIRKVYVEIKHQALMNPHTRNMIYAVRGKGEVKKHGASFYLRRIGER